MKRILFFIIFCFVTMLCVSCFKEADFGFPKKITFPKEGGELVFRGNRSVYYASVSTYNGGRAELYYDEGKQFYILDWLKVEMNEPYSDSVKFYAKPNTTGKKRKLYVDLYSGPEYAEIKVLQQ